MKNWRWLQKQDAENAKNDIIRLNNQSQFYLYLFNGKELATRSLSMQGNDTLRALLAISAFDMVTYAYENFSFDKAPVKYDNEILKSLQNAFSLFEKDLVASGEIRAIASKNKKMVFSRGIGQLIISELEDKDPADLPSLSEKAVINLTVNSLVQSLAFDPAKSRLACGMIDGNVILINNPDLVITDQNIIYNNNNNRVYNLSFIPGKEWLISSSNDGKICIWDLEKQTIVKESDPEQSCTEI